jgi:hypothetical protein
MSENDMKDHAYVFNYFESRLLELKEEYGFNLFENNPCSIRTKEDIKTFVDRLSRDLFEENDYSFINEEVPGDRLEFNFKGQALSFAIESKFGHIEPDFFRTVKFMAFLSGKMIATTNPAAAYVVGEEDEMREAWAMGLPIHLPEINFRHRNMTGKYFKREEVGAVFVVDGVLTPEEYEAELIVGLNDFLKQRSYGVTYSSRQIKAYYDHRKHICALINGDYCGDIKVRDGKMIIKNGFENQVFLSRYLEKRPKSKILYQGRGSDTREEVLNFIDFVSRLGKEG